jgi:hypothetical protein
LVSACTLSGAADNTETQSDIGESTVSIGDWDSADSQNFPNTFKVGVLLGLSGDRRGGQSFFLTYKEAVEAESIYCY